MSLNKFSDTVQKDWMNIGCNDIVCNELTLGGKTVRSTALVFATTTGGFSTSIFPAIQPVVTIASAGIGTLVSSGYTAGNQLRVSSSVIINSVSASNNVNYFIYPMGAQVIIPYATWVPNTNVVIESVYTFVNATNAYLVTTVYLPDSIQIVPYGLPISFPSVVPYNLSISCSASGPCTLTHVQTTFTLL